MNPDPTDTLAPRLPEDPAEGLPDSERAELQRQGSKAAARGDEASSNPMHEPLNMPEATGESSDLWRQREEAWQQGHDAQSSRPDAIAPPPGSPSTDDGRK